MRKSKEEIKKAVVEVINEYDKMFEGFVEDTHSIHKNDIPELADKIAYKILKLPKTVYRCLVCKYEGYDFEYEDGKILCHSCGDDKIVPVSTMKMKLKATGKNPQIWNIDN